MKRDCGKNVATIKRITRGGNELSSSPQVVLQEVVYRLLFEYELDE
jgi:hypothetical protein